MNQLLASNFKKVEQEKDSHDTEALPNKNIVSVEGHRALSEASSPSPKKQAKKRNSQTFNSENEGLEEF